MRMCHCSLNLESYMCYMCYLKLYILLLKLDLLKKCEALFQNYCFIMKFLCFEVIKTHITITTVSEEYELTFNEENNNIVKKPCPVSRNNFWFKFPTCVCSVCMTQSFKSKFLFIISFF